MSENAGVDPVTDEHHDDATMVAEDTTNVDALDEEVVGPEP